MDLRKRLGLAIIALASPALLTAQVDLGDIALVGTGGPALALLRPGTGLVTVHALPALPAPATSVLWDARRPRSFLLGGAGYVARCTLHPSLPATTQLLTTTIGDVTDLAWSSTGQLLAYDATHHALRALDPSSGVTTRVSSTTDPWPHGGSALAADDATGSIYLAGAGLWRLALPQVSSLVPGAGGDLDHYLDLAVDELSSDVFALHTHQNRCVRIDPLGQVSDVVAPGSFPAASALTVTLAGDLVVAEGILVHLQPRFGAPAAPLAVVPASFGGISSLSVVGSGRPFLLGIEGRADHSVEVTLHHVPAGAAHGWLLASADTTTAPGLGPAAGIVPDDLAWSIVGRYLSPQVDHPWHWLAGVPGHHPDVPYTFVPGTTATVAGQDFDFVAVALTSAGNLVAQSNVERVTF